MKRRPACARLLLSCACLFAGGPVISGQGVQQGKQRVETEVIELGRYGFIPRQITRPAAGKHYIFVRNVTGIRSLALRLESEGGPSLKEVALHQAKPRWNELLDLAPGVYVLREANHPNWVCRITIAGGKN